MFVVLQESSLSYDHSQHMSTLSAFVSSCSTLQGSWRQLWFSRGWFLGPNTPSECMGLVLATLLASALRTFAPWSCAASTCVSQSAPGCGVSCDPHLIRMWPTLHPCVSCVGDYCNTGSQALYMRSCNSCSPVPCSQATNNLEALFEDEPVRPVLLHGDFWNGNFAGTPNGSKWGMHGHAIHAECCTWNAGKILAFGLMSLFAFVVASSLIPAPSSQRGKQRIAKVPTCGYL